MMSIIQCSFSHNLLNNRNTIKIGGPNAEAITALGDMADIANPVATAQKVSKLTTPTNIKKQIGLGFKFTLQ